jgi:hypothetical protein
MRAGEIFFLRKFSTIPLTTFARFACSLRSWNDNFNPGTDVMIFNFFSRKIQQKYLRFFAQTTASFFKNVIKTLVFEKNAIFFAENCDHNIDPWTQSYAFRIYNYSASVAVG